MASGAGLAALGDALFAVSRAPVGALSARGSLAVFEHALAYWCVPAFLLGVAIELFASSAYRQPRVLDALRWLATGPRAWFRRDADRSTATTLALAFAAIAFGPVFPAALFVGTTFHSRPLASLAIFLVLIATTITAALVVLVFAAPVAWFFRRVPAVASPGLALAAAALVLGVPIARVALRLRPLFASLDHAFVLLPLALVAGALTTAFAVARMRPRGYGAAAWLVALAQLALPALSIATLGRDPVVARALVEHAPLAGAVVALIQQASDRDGDGFGALAGGGDCDDRSRAVHPGAVDVPGNHRDEDCSGRDALVRAPPDEPRDSASPIAGSKPFIVLITLDGVPANGCAPPPGLAPLVGQSACFSRAYSPADRVGQAIASVMTGRPASELPWSGMSLASDAPTVPARLSELQYFTAAFSTDDAIARHPGLRRGVIETHDGGGTARDAAAIALLATKFLQDRGRDQLLSLLHVHFGLFDPRTAPAIQSVITASDALARLRPVVLVVTGAASHAPVRASEGGALREAALRVPLFIRGPSIVPGERREPCSLYDLAPTFFALAGSPPPWPTEGRSLIPLLSSPPNARPWPPRALIAEGFDADDAARATRIAWLVPGYQLIASPAQNDWALYDLARDPTERANRFDPSSEPSRTLREAVSSYVPYALRLARPLDELRLDARTPTHAPPDEQRLTVRYAGAFELDGFDRLPRAVAPGGVLRIALYYRTLTRTRTPLWLQIAFEPVTPGAGPLPVVRRWPLDGRDPTRAWNVGEARREVISLVVPHDAHPGRVRVRFSVLSDPDLAALRPEMGAEADGSVALGEVVIGRLAR